MPTHKIRSDRVTLHQLECLGSMFATTEETARFFRMSRRGIEEAFKREPALQSAFDHGRTIGVLNLRRKVLSSSHPWVLMYVARALFGRNFTAPDPFDEGFGHEPETISDDTLDAIGAALEARSLDPEPRVRSRLAKQT